MVLLLFLSSHLKLFLIRNWVKPFPLSCRHEKTRYFVISSISRSPAPRKRHRQVSVEEMISTMLLEMSPAMPTTLTTWWMYMSINHSWMSSRNAEPASRCFFYHFLPVRPINVLGYQSHLQRCPFRLWSQGIYLPFSPRFFHAFDFLLRDRYKHSCTSLNNGWDVAYYSCSRAFRNGNQEEDPCCWGSNSQIPSCYMGLTQEKQPGYRSSLCWFSFYRTWLFVRPRHLSGGN